VEFIPPHHLHACPKCSEIEECWDETCKPGSLEPCMQCQVNWLIEATEGDYGAVGC
jgi:hypothetical protein